ncbi:hypothetical protein ENSA5_01490 [Enhygromyxa salina]|uniref:DUF2306 domain-containing protein n=1 Tax=Enhygromyxa salina TaxID=215803 RepID=A0A2S9YL55_9BACT|nr:hypothetical protein [Enhygromyxa salina]PRQ05829.1 hypothetical protein ENSA5_01490 [Enhygromyxa salina]
MFEYATLRELLMPIHGVIGLVAILSGVVALSLPKRPSGHPWAGRLFMLSMGLAIAVAAPVVFVGGNLFLMGVGLLVIYHGLVAWRLARLQPPKRRPGPLDRALHPGFAGAFLLFGGYGAWALLEGQGMGVVALVLSTISLGSVWHFRRFMNLDVFEADAWVGEHIRGVAAAFIASLTAFAAATGPRLAPGIPAVVLWLGPTVLLTPLFIWFGRQQEQPGSAADRP